MFWGVLIFVLVLVIGASIGLGYYWFGWSWGDPIPPAPLTPFITSAVATSADTIHLTLSKGSGQQVQLERSQPENPSSVSDVFYTPYNELDDTGLKRDTLYSYRARYTTNPPGPWSPSKEARTLPH